MSIGCDDDKVKYYDSEDVQYFGYQAERHDEYSSWIKYVCELREKGGTNEVR